MYPYWLLFTFFAIGSLTARSRLGPSDRFRSFGFLAGFILLTVMIGLRDQIGLDWNKYEYFFTMVARKSLLDVLLMRDPAYFLLDWAAQQLDAPFWVANSVGALIFNWGLYRFARTQPEPWLVVLAAIPYLVIVVAMGMARQGIAIGILLGGLAGLHRRKAVPALHHSHPRRRHVPFFGGGRVADFGPWAEAQPGDPADAVPGSPICSTPMRSRTTSMCWSRIM